MKRNAFTLVELLVVVGIMIILAAISIPAMRGLGKSQSITSAVTVLNGILNNARQEAITKNTYVYVAMGNVPAVKSPNTTDLWIVTFTANDGMNSIDLSSAPSLDLTAANNGWQLTAAARSFEQVTLCDRADDLSPKPSSLPSPDVDPANINPLDEATISISAGGNTIQLNRLMVFTPNGQAMSDAELNQYVEFGIVAAQNSNDCAVFRISGNLGVITVYRN